MLSYENKDSVYASQPFSLRGLCSLGGNNKDDKTVRLEKGYWIRSDADIFVFKANVEACSGRPFAHCALSLYCFDDKFNRYRADTVLRSATKISTFFSLCSYIKVLQGYQTWINIFDGYIIRILFIFILRWSRCGSALCDYAGVQVP